MEFVFFIFLGIVMSGWLVMKSVNKDKPAVEHISYMDGIRIAFTRAGVALVLGLCFGKLISVMIEMGWMSIDVFKTHPFLFSVLGCVAGLVSFAAYHLIVGKVTGEDTSLVESFRYTLRELGMVAKFLIVAIMILAIVIVIYDFGQFLMH